MKWIFSIVLLGLESHYFPNFTEHSFQEHMFPSISNVLLENSVIPLKNCFCRWPKEIRAEELPPNVSIVHPVKNNMNPIRVHAREKREERKRFLND